MTGIVTSSEYTNEQLVTLSGKLLSSDRAKKEAKVFLASFEKAPTATPATTDHFFAAIAAGEVDFKATNNRKKIKKILAVNSVLRADLLGLEQKNVKQFEDPNQQAISVLANVGRQKVVAAFLSDKSSKEIYEQFMLKDDMYKSFSAEELRELVLKDVGAATAIFDDKAPNSNQPALKVASEIKADDIARLLATRPENNEHYFPIVLAFALKYCGDEFKLFWNNPHRNFEWQEQINRINEILFSEKIEEKYTDFIERIETSPKAFLTLAKDNSAVLARLLMHANNPIKLLKTIIANDRDESFSEFISKNAVDFISAFKEELFKRKSKLIAEDLYNQTLKLNLVQDQTIGSRAEQQTQEKVLSLVFPICEVEQLSPSESSLNAKSNFVTSTTGLKPNIKRSLSNTASVNELLSLLKDDSFWPKDTLVAQPVEDDNSEKKNSLSVQPQPKKINIQQPKLLEKNDADELLSLVKKPDLWKNFSLSGQYGTRQISILPLNQYLNSQSRINENRSKLDQYFYKTYTSQYNYEKSTDSYSKKPNAETPDLSYELAYLIKNSLQYKKFKSVEPKLLDRVLSFFGYKTESMIKLERSNEQKKQSVALIKYVLRNQTLQEKILALRMKAANSLEQLKIQLKQLPALDVDSNHANNKDNKELYERELSAIEKKVEIELKKNLAFATAEQLKNEQLLFESMLDALARIRSQVKTLDPNVIGIKNQITELKRTSDAFGLLDELDKKIVTMQKNANLLIDTSTNEKVLIKAQQIKTLRLSLNKLHVSMESKELYDYKSEWLHAEYAVFKLQEPIRELEREVELKLEIKKLKQADELSEVNLAGLITQAESIRDQADIVSTHDDNTLNQDAADLLQKISSFLVKFQKNHENMSLSELESYKKVCEDALNTVSEFQTEIGDLFEKIDAAKPTASIDPSSAPPSPIACVDSSTPFATPTAAVSPPASPNFSPMAAVSPSTSPGFLPAAYLSPQSTGHSPRANVSQPGSISGTPVASVSQPASSNVTPIASLSPIQDSTFSPAAHLSPQSTGHSPRANVSQPGSISGTPVASVSQPASSNVTPIASLSPIQDSTFSPAAHLSPQSTGYSPSANVSQPGSISGTPVASVSQPASSNVTPIASVSPIQDSTSSPAAYLSPQSTGHSPSADVSQPESISGTPVASVSQPASTNVTPAASVSPTQSSTFSAGVSVSPAENAAISPVAAVSPLAEVSPDASTSPAASVSAPGTINNSPEKIATASVSPLPSPSAAVSPAPATAQTIYKFEASNLLARLDESDGLEAKSEKTKQYLRGKSPAFVAEFFGKNMQTYEQMLLDGKAKELMDTINKALASKNAAKFHPPQDENNIPQVTKLMFSKPQNRAPLNPLPENPESQKPPSLNNSLS